MGESTETLGKYAMTITKVFRARHYWFNGDRVWFEECPAVHETDRFVTVRSVTYPTIQYPGGNFRLDKENLLKSGKKYHSRHGEYFYLTKPRQGDLFPSKELLESPDFIMQEAASLGWDVTTPLHEWSEEDKACWLLAFTSKILLKDAVKLLAHKGLDGVNEEIDRVNRIERERTLMMIMVGEQ
jgi:hypothetical protein